MEPSEIETELSTKPSRLAGLILEIRDIFQKNLVATANARQDLERSIKSARDDAEAESRRFAPNVALLDRYSRAWNEYGEAGGPPSLKVAAPATLHDAADSWTRCAERCDHVLEDYRVRRQEYEEQRRRLFGKPKQEPRIPEGFRVDLWSMNSVLDALPTLQRQSVEELARRSERELTSAFESEVRQREMATARELAKRTDALTFGIEVLGHLGLSWPEAFVETQAPSNRHEQSLVRLGRFESVVPQVVAFEVPAVIEFPGERALAIEAPLSKRDEALSVARSVVLRSLAALPAGSNE